MGCPYSLLEKESQTKLQLPHPVWRVRRGIRFDRTNDSASATVDAGIALGRAEAQDGVVEYVISIKAELRFVFFGYCEVLRHRQIREERVRTSERVPSRVADASASRQGKRARGRTGLCAGVCPGQVRA